MKTQRLITGLMIVTILVAFGTQTAFSQRGQSHPRGNKEKIKSHKIAFITDKLELTPEEAEKFWPVYNQNEDRMEKAHKEFGEKYKEMAKDIEGLSEEDADEFVKARLEQEQKMFDLKKQFRAELKGLLSSKKVLLLMEAERKFKVELMRNLSGRGEGRNTGKRR